MAWWPSAVSRVEYWASFEAKFLQIADILKAETSVSGKAECLLAIGEDKKVFSFLEWPSTLNKSRCQRAQGKYYMVDHQTQS